MPTFVRYLLFQIPGWLLLALFLSFLVDQTAVPVWATVGFFVVWVLKDFAIYPIVRHSYERDAKLGSERLIGASGVAQETLAPQGYVKIRGELWKAQTASNETIVQNSTIKVRGARGMMLTVEADSTDETKRETSLESRSENRTKAVHQHGKEHGAKGRRSA